MSFSIPHLTTVEVTAAVPKFAWKTKQVRASATPVQNALVTIVDEEDGCVIESLSVFHHNDETDGKDIDCLLKLEGVDYLYDASDIGGMAEGAHHAFSLTAHNVAEAAYTFDQFTFQASTYTLPPFMSLHGFTAEDTSPGVGLFGHQIKLQIRMTSPVGTNPTMGYKCTYRVLEAV